MRKARNKKISLLMAIVFLFTIVVPLVGPAAAATGLRALSAPTVDDDSWERLGRVILEVEPEALRGGDTVIFSLPSGFDFAPSNATFKKEGNSWELSVVDGVYKTVYSAITVPDKVSGTLNDINIDAIDSVSWLDDNQISLKMKSSYTPVTNGELVFLQIDMNEVYIDDGHEGDIEFTSESPSGSGFPDDSVVVGTTGDGRVTISVVDDQTSNDDFDVTLRIKESLKGDIDDEKKDSIKFTLPDGFEWNETDGGILDYDTVIWGDEKKDRKSVV